MAVLNTMFNEKSNTACNNILFNQNTMLNMAVIHPSMLRLYSVSKVEKSALADLLNVSPQRVRNWEIRGLSKEAALEAQRKFGCDSNWLLGVEPKYDTKPVRPSKMSATEVSSYARGAVVPQDKWITEAVNLLESIPPEKREGAVSVLRAHVQSIGPPRDGQALQMAAG